MKDYQFHCEGCNESFDTSFIKDQCSHSVRVANAVRFPMKPNNAVVFGWRFNTIRVSLVCKDRLVNYGSPRPISCSR